ncbi:MAG: DoxX family membrane protein [Rhodospirillales bacterium]|nr:DoxX family membrane protein [Rhodospirillales bacterium]
MSLGERGQGGTGQREALALLAIRLAAGYFLLVWGASKIVIPEQTQALFAYFYGINLGEALPYALGSAQLAVAAGIVLGFQRRIVYGLGFLIHGTTVLITAKFWLFPLVIEDGIPIYRSYVTSLPALAAFIALYAFRDHDRWSLDSWLARRRRA